GPLASGGLHLAQPQRREEGAPPEAREAGRAAGVQRQRARRAEPVVDRPLRAVAAAQAEARGRSSIRSFLRPPLSPRDEISALAAGQVAAAMHDGSSRAEEGEPGQVVSMSASWRASYFTAAPASCKKSPADAGLGGSKATALLATAALLVLVVLRRRALPAGRRRTAFRRLICALMRRRLASAAAA